MNEYNMIYRNNNYKNFWFFFFFQAENFAGCMGDLFFGQDRVEMVDIIPRAVGVRQGCTEEAVHMITYPTANPGQLFIYICILLTKLLS